MPNQTLRPHAVAPAAAALYCCQAVAGAQAVFRTWCLAPVHAVSRLEPVLRRGLPPWLLNRHPPSSAHVLLACSHAPPLHT
ncbi:hypothetical protein GOBAR_AA02022 [Gossypium barbadense]|uniref:Uncharacterized protein n=1 Tax=Gossypium barbadense TaxID=3634 RepID=A0A2P5YSH9_GOSBA|nr:hypothetical protein GOBAR_AA02022 [Gossypium barbadense]